MSDVELKLDGIEKLLKALKDQSPPTARVGVLGDSTNRDDGGPTNATIGTFHEFGTSEHPVRSFLRVPISEHLESEMQKSGAFTPEALKEVLRTGSLLPYVTKMAVVAEGIVLEAFDSGGYGKWPPSDMASKKNHQTLVETQQLRNSITSEVTAGGKK